MKNIIYALLVIAITLFISCSGDKDEVKDFTAQNEKEIVDYLAQNNLTAQRTESGLHYIITKEGEGDHPTIDSTVTVIYKGYFTNGKVFDENQEGVSFALKNLIPGWKEGIPFFKPGGEGMLFVPAHLGYGSKGVKAVPGGSVLIFDIKLVSVN
ncbi:FKBP-type peptidyl-prolyl cis-trans isomerase [Flavobacterium ginsengiterrae]|uniref:Peptidyl-prolyl cis-trans isomerase n=1 Tax=Flavobacterium ginsengiterrae TaxID=871695 RepID=A0ABP7H0C3_9FLAO